MAFKKLLFQEDEPAQKTMLFCEVVNVLLNFKRMKKKENKNGSARLTVTKEKL
jgi:hypothetical protein